MFDYKGKLLLLLLLLLIQLTHRRSYISNWDKTKIVLVDR